MKLKSKIEKENKEGKKWDWNIDVSQYDENDPDIVLL